MRYRLCMCSNKRTPMGWRLSERNIQRNTAGISGDDRFKAAAVSRLS